MKIIPLLIIILSCSATLSEARSFESARAVIYGSVSMSIAVELIEQGKSIPDSWEGIPLVSEMLKNPQLSSNFSRLKVINSMALIPGAPAIQQEEGIPKRYWGCRLFAVSRDQLGPRETLDPVTGEFHRGRYCVSINGADRGSMGVRIEESEAQLIFKQFNNFDPAKQPLAFEETTAENGKPSYKLRVQSAASNSDTITQPTIHQKQELSLQSQRPESPILLGTKEQKTIIPQSVNYRFAWIITGIIFIIGSIGFLIHQKKNL
jgi:hypothetical protein